MSLFFDPFAPTLIGEHGVKFLGIDRLRSRGGAKPCPRDRSFEELNGFPYPLIDQD